MLSVHLSKPVDPHEVFPMLQSGMIDSQQSDDPDNDESIFHAVTATLTPYQK